MGGTLGALLTGFLATADANANLTTNLKDLVGNGLWLEQLKAIGVTIVWSVVATAVIAFIVKAVLGLRPDRETEENGLDQADHGEAGYHFEEQGAEPQPAGLTADPVTPSAVRPSRGFVFSEAEGGRQQLGDGQLDVRLAAGAGHQHRGVVVGELAQHLAAGAAGRGRGLGAGDHRHRPDLQGARRRWPRPRRCARRTP